MEFLLPTSDRSPGVRGAGLGRGTHRESFFQGALSRWGLIHWSPSPLALIPPDSDPARWFAQEVQPHEAALRSWLRAKFPSVSDMDDLVQETYARLLQARASGPIACPRAFVFVTARNLAFNRLRHARVERPPGSRELDPLGLLDDSTGIPERVARADDVRLLLEAIQALPARCRQIVTLRKIYGLNQREVADRLGVSESTVETQGTIGLRKCTEYFRRRGHLGPKRP